MPFNLVTIGWIAVIFILYTLMVVALPYYVLGGFLKGRTMGQKFMFCVVFGNFFYIMVVQLWGLLHFTNRYVLIATTLALPAAKLFFTRKLIWENILGPIWLHLGRFIRRENSFRYLLRKVLRWFFGKIKGLLLPGLLLIRDHALEAAFFVGCSLFVMYYFSVWNHFGPRASDLVVHMYWINGLDEGILFRAGIYPFGMHALLYYIHAVFNISTARLVLLFGSVQTFYIFTMLLVFLKELCRYRYTPYLSYVAFSAGNYIANSRYSRYMNTLPQEFGMIFLLPCAVALIHFFRAVREEKLEYKRMKEQKLLYTQITGKRRIKESTVWLAVLVVSFGLTLSAHFYITILAGILVLSAAAAYVTRLFDLKTLRRLIIAAVISVLIPVFPMAAAFAGGTPLQGSLYWALSVMGVDTTKLKETTSGQTTTVVVEPDTTSSDEALSEEDSDPDGGEDTGNLSLPEEETPVSVPSYTLQERILQYADTVRQATHNILRAYVFHSEQVYDIWCFFMMAMAALVPALWLFREWEYSRGLILILFYSLLMILLCISESIGLPVLIDADRSSIFFSYTALACVGMAVDAVLVILGRIVRVRMVWQTASLVLAAGLVFYTAEEGRFRIKEEGKSTLQRDGAVLCVFDIMEHYPEEKWTIVSCNEERNMISTYGWHYEVIDFLRSMENYDEEDEMYIPTQYVFFFVEKECLNYSHGEFADVDPYVSAEWASYGLPAGGGLSSYSDTQRIVTNSRMYYWAQEYQKRFPNEMKVFYEDDEFVCYFIEQNEYYLNNFAIDYGYNSRG